MLQFGQFVSGVDGHANAAGAPQSGVPMPAARPKVLFPLLVILLCLSAASPSSAAPQHHARKHPVKPQPAPVAQPAPAPAPLSLEQMPATPPQVTYHDNQLTIVAPNSNLSDILRAVRNQTGAAVDFPANATERVAAHFGPGPARDVLAALLNGSHFDYVMLGSVANPGAVERIILTSKTGTAPEPTPVYQATAQPAESTPQPQPGLAAQQPDPQDVSDDDFSTADEADDDQSPDQPAQSQEQFPANVQPGAKTPEQLLQELQRQQQQQQQLVQPGQVGPNGLPPGVPLPPNQQPQPPPQ